MEKLTRNDIDKIINSGDLNDHEIRKVIKEELKLDIPADLTREAMVDYVFKQYEEALQNIDKKKQEFKRDSHRVKSPPKSIKNGEMTKKEFIISLVKAGSYTRKQLIESVDNKYGYNLTGKTSKVRVSKVLKELQVNDKLELNPAGLLQYKGEE